MATKTNVKRVTVKLKNPNPLFEKWLKEWRDEAKSAESKLRYNYSNALKSLQKYPLPLETGKDCIILKGFGQKLCEMLDKKLSQYKQGNDLNSVTLDTKENKKRSPKKKSSVSKRGQYNPAQGSGPYAILLTLLKSHPEPKLKANIIERARYLSNKSFTKPDPGSFYTAWSSMSTLVAKELVIRQGNPPKFVLSEDGVKIAGNLQPSTDNSTALPSSTKQPTTYEEEFDLSDDERKINIKLQSNKDAKSMNNFDINLVTPFISSQNSDAVSQTTENFSSEQSLSQGSVNTETIIFGPHTFDVILLVDTQETAGGSQNLSEDDTTFELQRLNVTFEVRHLKVGDFTWICRSRDTNQELILPYIVERKRMDDLGKSIKDGRFHEQKFRLKQCGVQNLIYVVESYGKNVHTGLPLASLMQGATNTLVLDQFQVMFTESHRISMQYLATVTTMLNNLYRNKTVMGCSKSDLTKPCILSDDLIPLMTFKEFNKGASKTKRFKVREMFIRHLLQLKGVSVEKAMAIVDKYPTPKLLKNHYDQLGSQGEKLLMNIQFGPLRKNIGPVLSREIHQLYTTEKFSSS